MALHLMTFAIFYMSVNHEASRWSGVLVTFYCLCDRDLTSSVIIVNKIQLHWFECITTDSRSFSLRVKFSFSTSHAFISISRFHGRWRWWTCPIIPSTSCGCTGKTPAAVAYSESFMENVKILCVLWLGVFWRNREKQAYRNAANASERLW